MEPRFLFDTHSHAHDDLAHLDEIPELDVDKVALMGTSQNDWYQFSDLINGFCFSHYNLFI
jgi:hypothetical protein